MCCQERNEAKNGRWIQRLWRMPALFRRTRICGWSTLDIFMFYAHTVNQQALLPISPTSGLHVCICPAVSPATLQASAPWCWDSVHAAETNWSGSWRQWHCWPMAALSALPKSSSQPIFRWYPCQYPMQEILEKIGDSNVNVPMSGFLQGFWC